MPIITFWSDSDKTIGQTVSAAAVATVMAIEYNYKVLLLSADFNNTSMEKCFGSQESNNAIVKSLVNMPQINLDSGITGLLKMAENNRVTPEIIHDYTKIIFNNRLEVLYSPINLFERKDEINFLMQMKNIIVSASKYYDYVLVDLKKGYKYSEQIEILKISDIVIMNVEQKEESLKSWKKIEELKSFIHKIVFNICRYDNNSKYNIKNLSRKVLNQQKLCGIPYNTSFFEATQEGKIAEMFVRLKTIKEENENILFVEKIKLLIETIFMKYKEARIKTE